MQSRLQVKLFGLVAVFLFVLCFVSQAHSQASVNVSTLDPVYRDIDKLVAHGLVDKIIMGQRPFSRKEIARIIDEATKNLKRLEDPLQDSGTPEKKKGRIQSQLSYLKPLLERLQKEYAEELADRNAPDGVEHGISFHPLEKAEVDFTGADSPPEALVPVNNGLGSIDAVINPLLNNREGRHLVDGFNASLETSSWLRLSNNFALYFRPRFQLGIARSPQSDDNDFYLMNLYGKFYAKNFEIEIGRDNLFWGQGDRAGMLLSNNARGLDMIKLSNDSPFILPWIFKYLGPSKFTFFFAGTGPEQFFPNGYLLGHKWSFEPLTFFELGFSLTLQSGGLGSPPSDSLARVVDAIPIVNYLATIENGDKFAAIDFRFRIPPLWGLELYSELTFTDIDFRRVKSMFWEESGYNLGIYAPRLTRKGNVDLRLEYHHTGIRYYRHHQMLNGYTLNRFLIGDSLGPDSDGFYGSLNWDIDPKNMLQLTGALEVRDSNQYGVFQDNTLHFFVTQDNPSEKRLRGLVGWQRRFDRVPLRMIAQFGYERANNFNFVNGNDRNNFLGRVFLEWTFDSLTRKLK